jgi:hypothetical protein
MREDVYNGLDGCQPDGAARGRCLQHQAQPHGAAHLLRAHPGDAVQREPGAVQPGLLEPGAGAAAGLHSRAFRERCSPASATSSTPDCSRLRQACGVSGEYIWKYTHNAFDFSVLGNTPITFPIDWHNSKIPGYAARVRFPSTTASAPISSPPRWPRASSRRRLPEPAPPGARAGLPFRIDHDEKFNQTTHLSTRFPGKFVKRPLGRLQLALRLGLVAGSTPCYDITATTDPNNNCGQRGCS